MSKHIHILLIISILAYSCNDTNKDISNIGETEYYFEEKLSSISSDEDGTFWVGSETGDIFQFKDNNRETYELGEDRIYKVHKEITTANDTIFWIGIRNSGFQRWKKNGKKFEKIQTYQINFKGDRYSPYDFVLVDNYIYVATSQGLYSLEKGHTSDSLVLIYPSKEFLAKNDGTTFVVHNIIKLDPNTLLASTQDGLLWYDTQTNDISTTFKGSSVEHVAAYNDTIFAIIKEHLYLINKNAEIVTDINLGYNPKLYYRTGGTHYLIGAEEIALSNNLKDFYHFPLRRSVPIASRNLIEADTLSNFTYLLTENAVWRIPNNIEVFEGNKTIKAICTDTQDTYYLTAQNELYVLENGNKKAKWIYTFDHDNKIQWMYIADGFLYFYNLNNEFQKMKLSHKWIKNYILNSPEIVLDSEAKITAANVRRQKDGSIATYLGIQDGMISIDNKQPIDTISELQKAYITAMFSHKDTERLYIATLNDGVSYMGLNNKIKSIPGTQDASFIKDIIATNDHNPNLILLTNQQILSLNPQDSVRVKGYKRLLYASDTLFYALPEFGIHKFSIREGKIIDRGIYFRDTRFATNSQLENDRLQLASNVGALSFPADRESEAEWIQFDDALNINMLQTILLICILMIIFASLLVIISKRRNTNIMQIRKRKEDLCTRLDDVISYYDILDETESAKIAEIKRQVTTININAKDKKAINALLEKFSLRIANLNRHIALLLPKKLDEQIEEIERTDSFEKTILLTRSYTVRDKDDIELIKDQIKTNTDWLNQRLLLHKSIDSDILQLSGCAEIEGVNKHLLSRLINLKEDDKHKKIVELSDKFNNLKPEIQNIDSAHSRERIEQHINELHRYLSHIIRYNEELQFLADNLEKAKIISSKVSNIEILRHLKPVDNQVKVLRTLEELNQCTTKYKEVYDQIIRDNNKLLKKKFDKELDSYIEDSTQNLTRQINVHIASLYDLLIESDQYIVTDVLKLTNPEGQHAKVLALLIADLKIKRSLIPAMLGIYGNLNPVISRLINNRIKPNEDLLKEHQRNISSQSVFVHLVLKLLH